MILEIHDAEYGNTLAGKVSNIDYDYQAEQWVQDITTDACKDPNQHKHRLDQFILVDDEGVRALWKFHENGDVELTFKAERFAGKWQMNLRFGGR